jgi:hypothetical protein
MEGINAVVAWWGAVIATFVFVWDIYKWRKAGRPQLRITAAGNMESVNAGTPRKFIVFRVTNVGDKPTTIETLALEYFKQRPPRWRNAMPDTEGVIAEPISPSKQLPHKLEVGEQWSCLIIETDEFRQWSREGYLYFYITDSATKDFRKFAKTRFEPKDYA